MSAGNRPPKVAFAQELGQQLIALSEFLSTERDWVYFEFQGSFDETWTKVVATVPDLTVLFCPEITDREKRVVSRLLIGCRTKIFIVSYRRPLVDVETGNFAGRVEVCIISGSESSRTAVYALTRYIDNVRRGMSSVSGSARETMKAAVASAAAKVLSPPSPYDNMIIAFGASTGGTEALEKVFKNLPKNLPGIVVVQHMPPVFTQMYASRLNNSLAHDVMEAEDNVQIRPGSIHIAPGDRHLTIKKRGGAFFTSLGGTHKVSGHCPSVDVLFESVAAEAGARAMGVILTGMGADGASGLLSMRQRGAHTIGQDEASCVVYGMPWKAFECGAVARQASLLDIPKLIAAHYARGG